MSLINSLFSAQSGLRAANAGVNATSNNVANSATPGYNRRAVDQVTANPTRAGRLNYGNGSSVSAIGRSSDNLLNMRRLKEAGAAVSSETEYYQLTSIERLFDETQSTTPRGELDAFFDSLTTRIGTYINVTATCLHANGDGGTVIQGEGTCL